MRAARKALRAAAPEAGREAAAHLDAVLAAAGAAKVAALYLPMHSEFDALPLAEALGARGVRLAMPRAWAEGAPLDFHAWSPGDAVEADASGSAAPLDTAEKLEPDLVFVPLVAFDTFGGRLGQGGGYYDRTLEALARRDPRPLFVGLGFGGQQVERVPCEGHDQKLDGVLTESGYMPARKDV